MYENKNVCSNHFEDRSIRDFIRKVGKVTPCNYCKRKFAIAADLDDVASFLEKGFSAFYDESANWLPYISSEGGYQGQTFTTGDLLREHVEFQEYSDKLFTDLNFQISDYAWCYDDPFGDTISERMLFDWKAFKTFVLHKSRYTFFLLKRDSFYNYEIDVAEILSEIGELINKYHLVHTINPGTILHRCRQHDASVFLLNAEDISSPPNDAATLSNRMSPAGISMFYGSFDEETAIRETIVTSDNTRPFYTIGKITPNRELLIVDFNKLPPIPSIFDERKRKNYYPLLFLHQFVGDLSKPISRDGREHIEYVPTQIVTEYIRYKFSKTSRKNIDGIIFPSSRNPGHASCVLFLDHEESLKALNVRQLEKRKVP